MDTTIFTTELSNAASPPAEPGVFFANKTHGDREFAAEINGRAMNDLGGGGAGAMEITEQGPVSVTLRAVSDNPLKHETSITLTRGSRRIAIRNEIRQNFADVRTWAFSFALDKPLLRHEELGAILTARLVSNGGHYSDQNARYDWLTLNHFADVCNRDVGVTLSNADCSFMRFGQSTTGRLDTNTPQLSVLAGGRVDGPGFANQGDDETFLQRFALATHERWEMYDAMRFAMEHQNPLVAGLVTVAGRYPERTGSLVRNVPRPLVIWALKPAEEGIDRGVIVRMWNVSAQPVRHRFATVFPIRGAKDVTHIETDIGPADVSNGAIPINLPPWRIRTWRVLGGNF